MTIADEDEASAREIPPGTLLAGKFRIERRLGSGAMGAVYAVVHERTQHRRALKLLHPAAQQVPDLVRRFLDEASAAGRVGNAHLVETFDAAVLPSGEPYVVMELLDGETLGALLERENTLPVERAAEIVAQAAEGIEAANRAGIVHGDLKPENLFVTSRNGAPFVKVLDFGVSTFTAASGTPVQRAQAGAVCGSPAYMAPEQLVAGPELDARVDVFALGVVLFEALAGVRPYEAPDLQGLVVRVLSGRATAIETLRPDVPPELRRLLARSIAQRREERLPSAGDLAAGLAPFRPTPRVRIDPGALQPAVGGPAPSSRPPPAPVVALATAGRRSSLGAILGVGTGVLVVGAALTYGLARRSANHAAATASAPTPPLIVAAPAGPAVAAPASVGALPGATSGALSRAASAPPVAVGSASALQASAALDAGVPSTAPRAPRADAPPTAGRPHANPGAASRVPAEVPRKMRATGAVK